MLDPHFNIFAKANKCDNWQFMKFSKVATDVINKYKDIDGIVVYEEDNAIAVTTSNQSVALIVEHELRDIALIYGVNLK